ncbi:MAG: hypothetical protein JXQ73_33865 [Phycisphaerae bacterium]|nr:hypothetical protein [Phycisphaerae bacterium]
MRCKTDIVGVASFSVGIMCVFVVGLAIWAGCYCPPTVPEADPNTGQVTIRTDDPLSDQIADDANLPYDRPAALTALEELDLLEPNLGGYKFAILFIVQNQFDSDIAFDVYVNFQKIEPRRLVQTGRQEIVVVSNEIVEQSEDALRAEGVASGDPNLANLANTADIFGRPCPYIVELRNFVSPDDHIITNRPFLLSPLNAPGPDGTHLAPVTKDTPPLRLEPVYECPAILAVVIEKTRIRLVELDREFTVPDYTEEPQEPADPGELLFPFASQIIWLDEQITVFEHFGQEFLLQAY